MKADKIFSGSIIIKNKNVAIKFSAHDVFPE